MLMFFRSVATLSNNLLGDEKNMDTEYIDEDVVVDDDLVTGLVQGDIAICLPERLLNCYLPGDF